MKSKVAAWTAALALLVLGFVFWAAECTPYLDDDYRYIFSFYTDAPLQGGEMPSWKAFARIPNKCARLVEDVERHYRTECGRFVTACVERPLAAMPRGAFAALAAAFFVVITLLTARLAGVRTSLPAYLAGFFVVCYDWSTCAWLAGSCNYLFAAVFGLAAVLLFLRPRLQESAFKLRNLWFAALVPIGFVLAGWHEQLSLALCLLMAVYWLREWFARRRFPIDGRLLLCVGFGLGAMAVAFAPGTTGRAETVSFFEPDVSWAFSLARRVRCFGRLIAANPANLLAVVASVGFVCSRKFRVRLDTRARWVLLAGWIMFLETCLLTDGTERRGWFAAVFSMMMTAVAAPVVLGRVRAAWQRAAGTAVCVAFAAVMAVTAYRVHEKDVAHAQDMAALRASPYCMVEFRPGLRRRLPGLDRSFDYRLAHGMPEAWLRILPARLYGREALFVFSREEMDFFLRPDLPEMMRRTALAHCPEWAEIPGSDIVFTRHEGPVPTVAGERLCARPVYEKGAPVRHDFDWLWRRFWKSDWADFSMVPPEDEMASDKILTGFVLLTPTGAYDVFMHSHFIPRSRIRSLTVEKIKTEGKYLWNS